MTHQSEPRVGKIELGTRPDGLERRVAAFAAQPLLRWEMESESGLSNSTTDAWVSHGPRSCKPLALVFSDTPSADLGVLSSQRCQAALPFAGKYRLIDFALSNCESTAKTRALASPS